MNLLICCDDGDTGVLAMILSCQSLCSERVNSLIMQNICNKIGDCISNISVVIVTISQNCWACNDSDDYYDGHDLKLPCRYPID